MKSIQIKRRGPLRGARRPGSHLGGSANLTLSIKSLPNGRVRHKQIYISITAEPPPAPPRPHLYPPKLPEDVPGEWTQVALLHLTHFWHMASSLRSPRSRDDIYCLVTHTTRGWRGEYINEWKNDQHWGHVQGFCPLISSPKNSYEHLLSCEESARSAGGTNADSFVSLFKRERRKAQ